ncbi:MAG: ABC transporter substrate-binding protein [Sedimentisphaerales bacterium]|nr:ABC transporter substrate-binding protein [Sedimentisphaerales bacterium]
MKLKTKLSVFLLTALFCLVSVVQSANSTPKTQPKSYSRIISLAPSTTEILFSLGLGDKVIGVSEFCDYPVGARTKLKIGGLLNPNYEAIVAAKPDLVITFDDMAEAESKFKTLGIDTLVVKHDRLDDIFDSIVLIGQHCDKAEDAEVMVGKLKTKMQTIKNQCVNQGRPKVLIVVGHSLSQDTDKAPENIYIAGKDDFYSTMLELAGGQNAYTGSIAFPAIGYESLISMNPQIIIDIVSVEQNRLDAEIVIKQWKNLDRIDAVKNDRIHIFGENYMAIPGPRFILTLEKIARVINPRLKLEDDESKSY